MSHTPPIERFLVHVRRRERLAVAGEVVGAWLIALILIGMLGLALVSAELLVASVALRLSLSIMAGLATVTAFGRYLWRVRHVRSTLSVASLVESRVTTLSGAVRTAVELTTQLDQAEQQRGEDPRAGMARGLALAHLASVAATLSAVPPRSVTSLSRARQRLSIVLVLLILAAPLFFLPSFIDAALALIHGVQDHADEPQSVAHEHSVLAFDLDVRLSYPAYTRLPARYLENTSGDLAALLGTRVELTARALVPAIAAALVWEDTGDAPAPPSSDAPAQAETSAQLMPRTLPLTVAPDGVTLTGDFTVRRSGRYRFQLTSAESGLLVEQNSRTIEALVDVPPTATIFEPEAATRDETLEVRSLDPVRVGFQLTDDFGLGEVELVVRKVGGLEGPTRRRIAVLNGERNYVGGAELELRRFQLEPGEVLTVLVEAVDGNSVAAVPGRGRSRELRIRLYSADERHAENLEAQRALMDAMLDVLADRLESPIALEDSAFEAVADAQGRIVLSSGLLLDRLARLAQAMEDDPIAADGVEEALVDMRTRHAALVDQEGRQVSDARSMVDQSEKPTLLAALVQSNTRGISELETDIPWLDRLLAQQDKERLLNDAKSLVALEREIRELMEKLKKGDDPALRAELQRRLEELLRKVDQMTSNLSRSAKPMPFENANMDAMEQADARGLDEVRSSVESLMAMVREGRLDEAMASIDSLSKAIQGMNSRIEEDAAGPGGDGGSGPPGAAALRQLNSDVDRLENKQRALERDARQLDQAVRDSMSERIADALAPEIAGEMGKLRQVTDGLGQISRDGLHADDQKRLDELQKDSEQARENLSAEQLPQAGRQLEQLGRDLESLKSDLDVEATRPGAQGAAAKAAARSLGKVGSAVQEVGNRVEELTPDASELLDPAGRQRLDELARRQKDIEERAKRIEDDLGKVDTERPGTKGGLGGPLESAQKAMKDASKHFEEKRDPGRGAKSAERAGDRLQELSEAIDRELGTNPQGRGGVGGTSSRSRVAIPDSDRYSVPKEFREELLKSVKEQAPARYRSLIERYYEALVQ